MCLSAYQALKTLATHKTDRNDARGLAQLARTGFFKPVHVKSLPSHAVRALIMARKKLVGQRIMLENQIRGLAVVFGTRLPGGLSLAFVDQVFAMSDGIAGLSSAMRGLIAAREAVLAAIRATWAHTSAWCHDDISRVRSTIQAAFPRWVIDACERCSMKRPTSC